MLFIRKFHLRSTSSTWKSFTILEIQPHKVYSYFLDYKQPNMRFQSIGSTPLGENRMKTEI
jgi:hypothetical protein